VFPIEQYRHDGSDCTVIGGFVYRGTQFPNMAGKYIFADYCSGRFKTIYKQNGVMHKAVLYVAEPFEYVSLGEDVNKELYVADLEEGEIYHVVDSSQLRLSDTWSTDIDVALYPNPATDILNVEWYSDLDQSEDIFIYNSVGQVVMHQTNTAAKGFNHLTLNAQVLGEGNYILEMKTAEGIAKKQFQME
jgi:hypothetical protein